MQMDQSFRMTRVMISSLFLTASVLTGHALGADDRIPMRLELEVDGASAVVGENFAVTLRGNRSAVCNA